MQIPARKEIYYSHTFVRYLKDWWSLIDNLKICIVPMRVTIYIEVHKKRRVEKWEDKKESSKLVEKTEAL